MKKLLVRVAFMAVTTLASQAALIAHYTFDGTLENSVAGGADAVLGTAGSITTADVAVGSGALSLSGTPSPDTKGNDGAYTGNSFTWTADQRTIAFWMKASAGDYGDAAATMIGLGPVAAGIGGRFDLRITGNNLRLEVNGGSDSSVPVADGTWHHVAVIVEQDGATLSNVAIYLDGVYQQNFGTTTALVTKDGPMAMGDRFNDLIGDYKGLIDDVQLYDHALSASDVASLFGADTYIANFTATPDRFLAATDVTLNWNTLLAGRLEIDDGASTIATFTSSANGQSTLDSGGLPVGVVSNTTTYTLIAMENEDGSGSTVTQQVTVVLLPFELASPFQDGMVLQRDKPIAVWGWAVPHSGVSVEINGVSTMGTADADGKWRVDLPALPAGGPYSLVATNESGSTTLNDVLIGDVWITFGQSNMVRPLSEMTGAQTYIDDITQNDLPIRCLKVHQWAATSAQEKGDMTWLDNTAPGNWTAVGAVFAHQMCQNTGVPTAIIWAAWGSSYIEGWMPIEMTNSFPHFKTWMQQYYASKETRVIDILDGTEPYGYEQEIYLRTQPNIVYNQMMHPLIPYTISGFVWYQGEANASTAKNAAQYGFTLPAFVEEYRERFQQGDLLFLGVQLPSYNAAQWPWFRESQSRLTELDYGHVAVTIDTGLPGNIHPPDKAPIGQRLSLLARKYAFDDPIEAHGPIFSSITINGSQVTIGFTHADGLTTNDGLDPATFQLAASDQVWYSATSSSISGTNVTISSTSVPAPVAVRYAWTPAPVYEVNLVNSDGLPTAPFRTDFWPIPDLGAQAPQAVADLYATHANQTLAVPKEGILGNDMDLNHDPLTASLVDDVAHGTLTLSADGAFTYIPNAGYTGPDSFTYQCSDGGLSSAVKAATINVGLGFDVWWSAVNWNSTDDDSRTGDPDGDRILNYFEYAYDLDPNSFDATGTPVAGLNGNDFEFGFRNAQAGLIYRVLLSTNLVDGAGWSPYADLTSESTTPIIIPGSEMADKTLFIQLEVEE